MLADDSLVMRDDTLLVVIRIENLISSLIGELPSYETTKKLSLAETQVLLATRI